MVEELSSILDPRTALQDSYDFWDKPFKLFKRLSDDLETSYKNHMEATERWQRQRAAERKAADATGFHERAEYREDGNEAILHTEL